MGRKTAVMNRSYALSDVQRRDRLFTAGFRTLMLMGVAIYWYYMMRLEQFPPDSSVNSVVFSLTHMFHPNVLRHLIPLLVGWWLARGAALSLMHILYNLPDRHVARQYLNNRRSPPSKGVAVTVNSENLDELRKEHVLLSVGGPGLLQVINGETAVTELNGTHCRVLGPGKHTLELMEYVHSVLDLRPQERIIPNITLYTRDYIPMTADITINFRIAVGNEPVTTTKPYPFSKEAVRQVAYAGSVQPDGSFSNWDAPVLDAAKRKLTHVVRSFTLNGIMSDKTSFVDIHKELNKDTSTASAQPLPSIRNMLKKEGFDLISIHIDRIKPKEALVFEQYIERWKVEQEASIYDQKMTSETRHMLAAKVAQAEAELDMIRAIIDGVEKARREGAVIDIQSAVSLRLIQAMEGLVEQASENADVSPQTVASLNALNEIQLHERNHND